MQFSDILYPNIATATVEYNWFHYVVRDHHTETINL